MTSLYFARQIPIFQNKVYPSRREAVESLTGDVELIIDPRSGLIRNRCFDNSLMHYDENYQNEQGHSAYFLRHLEAVSDLVESVIGYDKISNIIEIGCGKGHFLEHLRSKGYSVTGYDPTYEGEASYVVKDYFGRGNDKTEGDLLILRHTMEHIDDPFTFLHAIAKANNYRGKIFIEVPTFDWIIDNNAFWDIFYEHCNYFNEASFANLFLSAQTGRLFGGQYMFIAANLSDLKQTVDQGVFDATLLPLNLTRTVDQWAEWLEERAPEGIAVWGAGAKGSTFVNRLDHDGRLIRCLVDINPRKYDHYVAGTGHYVMNPTEFMARTDVKHVIVMNPNYLTEIKSMLAGGHYTVLPL